MAETIFKIIVLVGLGLWSAIELFRASRRNFLYVKDQRRRVAEFRRQIAEIDAEMAACAEQRGKEP